MMEYLRDGGVQGWWLDTLKTGSFCSDNYGGLEDLCSGYLDMFLADMLSIASVNFWVDPWCQDVFGCQH